MFALLRYIINVKTLSYVGNAGNINQYHTSLSVYVLALCNNGEACVVFYHVYEYTSNFCWKANCVFQLRANYSST
jgi:hypothetical protein